MPHIAKPNEKKSLLKSIIGKAKSVKAKVVDTASTAMALPWTIPAQMKMDRSAREAEILRKARNGKGAPQFDKSGKPTEAFKYQTLADGIKQKAKKQ